MAREAITAQLGDVVDSTFRLVRVVGSGGFGDVWEADRLSDGARVAIKFLRVRDDDARARFDREAAALASLDHPNVLPLLRSGVHRNSPYIATPWVHGETLRHWQLGDHSAEARLHVCAQIADALAHAHREGIVHRDLKPDNVVVDDHERIVVLDFGLAKLVGVEFGDITESGVVLGTPGYMSPEQLRGMRSIGPATDLYCLGVIVWEIFALRPLFKGASALEIGMAHLTEAPPHAHAVPEGLRATVARLLSKEPKHRGTARRAAVEIRAATRPVDRPPSPTERRSAARPSHLPYILTIAAVVAISGVLAVIWLGSNAPEPQVQKAARRDITSLTGGPTRAEPPTPDFVVDLGEPGDLDTPVQITCEPVLKGYNEFPGNPPITVWSPLDGSVEGRSVVLVLHADDSDGRKAIESSPSLRAAAAEKNLILVAPTSTPPVGHAAWGESNDWRENTRNAREAVRHICANPTLLVYGRGPGARMSERLICESDDLRAVVSAVGRPKFSVETCNTRSDVAVMLLTPRALPSVPRAGGVSQESFDRLHDDMLKGGPGVWISLAQHEQIARDRAGCRDSEPQVERMQYGTCRTWECQAPLKSCFIGGGTPWVHGREREQGDGVAPKFDYDRAAIEFLAEHGE